jgi:hypothetical protein
MNNKDLQEIRAELAATTPGDWAMYDGYTTALGTFARRIGTIDGGVISPSRFGYNEIEGTKADFEFIARAHNEYIPALVEEVERLREALAGCMLLADDYTHNENERFSKISKRCRDELFAKDGDK